MYFFKGYEYWGGAQSELHPHTTRSQTLAPIWIPIAESVTTQNIYKFPLNSDSKVITIISDSDKGSEPLTLNYAAFQWTVSSE